MARTYNETELQLLRDRGLAGIIGNKNAEPALPMDLLRGVEGYGFGSTGRAAAVRRGNFYTGETTPGLTATEGVYPRPPITPQTAFNPTATQAPMGIAPRPAVTPDMARAVRFAPVTTREIHEAGLFLSDKSGIQRLQAEKNRRTIEAQKNAGAMAGEELAFKREVALENLKNQARMYTADQVTERAKINAKSKLDAITAVGQQDRETAKAKGLIPSNEPDSPYMINHVANLEAESKKQEAIGNRETALELMREAQDLKIAKLEKIISKTETKPNELTGEMQTSTSKTVTSGGAVAYESPAATQPQPVADNETQFDANGDNKLDVAEQKNRDKYRLFESLLKDAKAKNIPPDDELKMKNWMKRYQQSV